MPFIMISMTMFINSSDYLLHLEEEEPRGMDHIGVGAANEPEAEREFDDKRPDQATDNWGY
jgi:hypothetical protein